MSGGNGDGQKKPVTELKIEVRKGQVIEKMSREAFKQRFMTRFAHVVVVESLLTLPSIKKAIDKGVIVVRSSRTGSGPAYPGLLGDSLNPQKARIFLMLALTVTNNPERVQAMLHQF